MKIKNRNYGLDLVKIIACILVLCLHCLSPTQVAVKSSYINSSIYYAGTLAIPIFFMASSYFVLNKKIISYRYVFGRVKNILYIVLSWILLFSIFKLIIKHKFEFFTQLEGSMIASIPGQHFYHFWFFWALIIMLLISPMLWWLLHIKFEIYIGLTAIMTFICIGTDISLHLGNSANIQSIPQIFRLYLYIEYYLLGGLIGNEHLKRLVNFVKHYFYQTVFVVIILYALVIWYSLWNRYVINWVYAEANYGNIIVIITSAMMVLVFSTWNLKKQKQIIEFIIPATMGIYILHPFFIGKLSKIILFNHYPALMIPLLFVVCLFIVKVALRTPVVNQLFKL